MQVMVAGLNHETATVEIRERAAIRPEQLPRALAALRSIAGVREAAILSTCNRTELFVAAGPELIPGSLGHFLPSFHHLPPGILGEASLYLHRGQQAAAHLCAVASGLTSAVLGETQILAQVKEAYQIASSQHSLGPYLHQLFNLAIATAKQVHTDTAIGLNPISMGSVTVQAIRGSFAHLDTIQVLILGTGKMGQLVQRHLADAGTGRILLASRSADRARSVAASTGVPCIGPREFTHALRRSEVLITATTGLTLRKRDLAAMFQGCERRLMIVDLGVPRNVEAEAAYLPLVEILNVDHLKQVVEANLDGRRQTVQAAYRLINRAAERYCEWTESRLVAPLITSLSVEAERIRREELERILARMGPEGNSRWLLVEELTRVLTGRLLHECKQTLKRSATGRETGTRRRAAAP